MTHDKKNFAPIAIFAYNRKSHLQRVIESVKANCESKETDLHIFIDGPKTFEERQINQSIEKYSKSIKDFKTTRIYNSRVNLGLSKSITSGITKILSEYEEIIVLEDDTVVSPYFLEYINHGLMMYKNDEQVASIHGYTYPVREKLPTTFFLRGADCWGWGTWKRAWDKYNNDGAFLLSKIKNHPCVDKFDFEGYGGFVKMLQDTNLGKIDSWAIKWYASAFLEEMYTLYPGETLVNNIGLDGSGTHGTKNKKAKNQNLDHRIIVPKIKIEDNNTAREAFIRYFKSQNQYLGNKKIIKLRNFFKR